MKACSFDITQCQEYNSDTGKIETMMIDGVAGERYSEVVNREMDGDQLALTIQFYTDRDKKEKDEMKSYIFEFYVDGYYILQDKKTDV